MFQMYWLGGGSDILKYKKVILWAFSSTSLIIALRIASFGIAGCLHQKYIKSSKEEG